MKITGWTWYGNPEYVSIDKLYDRLNKSDITNIEQAIINELRSKGYHFTGDYHQNGDFGAPIFDGEITYECSQRHWGALMAKAYPDEIDNSDGMGYCVWAWLPSEPMTIPKEGDYESKL